MDRTQAKKLLAEHHKRMTSDVEAWRKVADQEFTHEEARDAADAQDVIEHFDLPIEELASLIDESEEVGKGLLSVGSRLYIAAKAELDKAGKLLLNEEDVRIRAVLRERCDKDKQGDRLIVIPGE